MSNPFPPKADPTFADLLRNPRAEVLVNRALAQLPSDAVLRSWRGWELFDWASRAIDAAVALDEDMMILLASTAELCLRIRKHIAASGGEP